jgi:hypothetical protein
MLALCILVLRFPAPVTPSPAAANAGHEQRNSAAGGTSGTQPAAIPSVESNISGTFENCWPATLAKLFGSSDEDKAYRDAFLKEQKLPLMGAGLAALALSREEMKQPKEAGTYQTFNPTWNRMMQSGGNYQPGAYHWHERAQVLC